MLIELKTKNFRKLRDRTFTFTPGLNILRGANEEGKSTMLEAISYAFFGVKACRQSLEEVVTWGEDVRTLRVDLSFAVEGIVYAIKRAKSGAELRWGDGQSVTGQSEVTAFIGRLFGTDPANIPNLILSGQGNIRGALDDGPKAATELIEDLADFGIIDDVLKLIGDNLLLGSPKPFEDKVARLEPELAQLDEALAQVPNTTADEDRLAGLHQVVAGCEAEVEALSAATVPLSTRRDELNAILAEQGRAAERLKLRRQQQTEAEMALAKLSTADPGPVNEARIEEIRALLADAERRERARVARAELVGYAVIEGDVWEDEDEHKGDGLKSFNVEVQRLNKEASRVQARISELSARARELRAQRITGECSACGKDVSEVPEVKVKNEAIGRELGDVTEEEHSLQQALKVMVGDITAMQAIQAEQTRRERLAAKHEEWVSIDRRTVPWRLIYCGPEMPDDGRAGSLRLELNELVRKQSAITTWEAKLQAARDALDRAAVAVQQATSDAEKPEYESAGHEVKAVQAQLDELNREYTSLVTKLNASKNEAGTLEADIRTKRAVYDAAKARVADVQSKLEDAKRDLDAVVFNNALAARVRAARPVIANKLWSKVLSTVSRYFGLMRGTDSVVSKDAGGFKVDGKEIDGLSGSTKDILGLAIRLALVRVFLPHAPFLILDEPSAACDANRTEAMMGFLVSAGFDQMLVVTHEDTSEQVATSLIEM